MSISAAASVSSTANNMALFKLANGEYSAGSVATNQAEANKLGLIKLKDGNYASLLAGSSVVPSSAAFRGSTGFQSALTNLTRG